VSDGAFSNQPIDVSTIPRLSDDAFVPVHPNYLRVSLIGSAIFAVIVLVAGILLWRLLPDSPWWPLIPMGVLLAITAFALVLKTFEVRNIAYQVREHDLSYRKGILVKSVQTVPFVRVQHAELSQGPVQRRFGLSTLNVNSAGPDLSIDGLGADEADRLRALVIERAGELVEEQ